MHPTVIFCINLSFFVSALAARIVMNPLAAQRSRADNYLTDTRSVGGKSIYRVKLAYANQMTPPSRFFFERTR